MATFLPVLFWGLAILAALTGWGRLLGHWTRGADHNPAADWLEAPAWGIAVSSLIGGLLNLAGQATRAGVVLFILAGCALFAIFLIAPLKNLARTARERALVIDWKWLALLVLPLTALALRFGGSVLIATYFPYAYWPEPSYLNPHDDAQSYLVSPERMLQTGSLGQDPFNSRQMMSALGAQHFLNAMALAIFAPEHVHIIEGGVGLAAACLAAAGLGGRLRLGRAGATLLMLVPLIARPWYLNISSTTTTVAVLIALCSALTQLFKLDAPPRRWLLTAGLLLGAACSLKSLTIPTAGGLVAVATILAAFAQKSWRPLGLGLLVGLVGLAVMGPWMWWQFHSSGTPLYPVFGRGFHVEVFFPSAPAPFHGAAVAALKAGLVLPILVLAGLLLAWMVPAIRLTVDRPMACVTLGIVAGWAIAWPLIAISTEYDGVTRYLVAARITALTLVLGCGWRVGKQLSQLGWRCARWAGPILLAAMLIGDHAELQITYGQLVPHDLANSMAGQPMKWDVLAMEVHTAQAAVPTGEKILTYIDNPSWFDFSSNPVFVADWPGEASPPPGMPIQQGAEAVASYLLGQDVRYVIYSYKSRANFPRVVFSFDLDPSLGRVMNRTTSRSFAFQDDLAELSQSRAHLYDDGHLEVLDLAHRLPPSLKPGIVK